MSEGDYEIPPCPLCMEELDATDKNFHPCPCGYQICAWCWHQLMELATKDNKTGRCPACRSEYKKEDIHFTAPEPGELSKKGKKKVIKPRSSINLVVRKNLANVRVIQRNLVYVIGLSLNLCKDEVLKKIEYFGKFGRIIKVSVNRNGVYNTPQGGSTGSAYVTFVREDDALRCIQQIDGSIVDGKLVRCSFGTTKYCNAFLKNLPCNNPECLYLHDLGCDDDSFTKEEMVYKEETGPSGKHLMFMEATHPGALGGEYIEEEDGYDYEYDYQHQYGMSLQQQEEECEECTSPLPPLLSHHDPDGAAASAFPPLAATAPPTSTSLARPNSSTAPQDLQHSVWGKPPTASSSHVSDTIRPRSGNMEEHAQAWASGALAPIPQETMTSADPFFYQQMEGEPWPGGGLFSQSGPRHNEGVKPGQQVMRSGSGLNAIAHIKGSKTGEGDLDGRVSVNGAAEPSIVHQPSTFMAGLQGYGGLPLGGIQGYGIGAAQQRGDHSFPMESSTAAGSSLFGQAGIGFGSLGSWIDVNGRRKEEMQNGDDCIERAGVAVQGGGMPFVMSSLSTNTLDSCTESSQMASLTTRSRFHFARDSLEEETNTYPASTSKPGPDPSSSVPQPSPPRLSSEDMSFFRSLLPNVNVSFDVRFEEWGERVGTSSICGPPTGATQETATPDGSLTTAFQGLAMHSHLQTAYPASHSSVSSPPPQSRLSQHLDPAILDTGSVTQLTQQQQQNIALAVRSKPNGHRAPPPGFGRVPGKTGVGTGSK